MNQSGQGAKSTGSSADMSRLMMRLGTLQHGLTESRDKIAVASEGRDSRLAAALALYAVCDFVDSFDDFRQERLSGPIFVLAAALHDIERGAHHPMLAPATLNHRPPSNGSVMGIRAAASIAIELRLRAGDSIESAARHVASVLSRRRDVLRELGVPAVEKITWRTVKNWRDRCKGAEIGDYEGDRYRNFCSRRLDDSIDLKSAADRILSASIEKFPKVMGRPPASAPAETRDGSK